MIGRGTTCTSAGRPVQEARGTHPAGHVVDEFTSPVGVLIDVERRLLPNSASRLAQEDEFSAESVCIELLVLTDSDGPGIDGFLIHTQLCMPVHLLAGDDVPAGLEVDDAQSALDLLDSVEASGDLPLTSVRVDTDRIDLCFDSDEAARSLLDVVAEAVGHAHRHVEFPFAFPFRVEFQGRELSFHETADRGGGALRIVLGGGVDDGSETLGCRHRAVTAVAGEEPPQGAVGECFDLGG